MRFTGGNTRIWQRARDVRERKETPYYVLVNQSLLQNHIYSTDLYTYTGKLSRLLINNQYRFSC